VTLIDGSSSVSGRETHICSRVGVHAGLDVVAVRIDQKSTVAASAPHAEDRGYSLRPRRGWRCERRPPRPMTAP
jgi:hypothetical protein